MADKQKFNSENVYHPENFDESTPLPAEKPQDAFLIDDDVTLITMENVKKLDQWEKEQKNQEQ